MKDKQSLTVECENCKQQFEIPYGIENGSIKHKQEYVVKGQSIFVTYYDCPSCGRRHFVQIDDKKSLEMLKDVKRRFVALSVLTRKGKQIPKKQSDKFSEARKYLTLYRNSLMQQYTGTVIKDQITGEQFQLTFSV